MVFPGASQRLHVLFLEAFGGVLSTDPKPFDIAILYFNDCGFLLCFGKLFERILQT